MPIKRSLLLLALVPSLIATAHAALRTGDFLPVSEPARQALPANNVISGLKAERAPDGGWVVTVDYHYTGLPAGARLEIKQSATRTEANVDPVPYRAGTVVMEKGRHSAKLRLERPSDEVDRFTQQLTAEMWDPRNAVITSLVVAQKLEWPDAAAMRMDNQVAGKSPELLMKQAVALIETGEPSALRQAKLLLERLLKLHPRLDQAYLELARVAMKTNWSPDGLREAEALIQSALQLRPDSVNARILLGYVYTNQGRLEEGLALFEEAARTGTNNLWLWTNWGELLVQQGQQDPAIQKFREAIKRPPTRDTNDGARQQAYFRLLQVYATRGNLDAVEALHKQRRADYPGTICYDLAHARFLVTMRGDAAGAESILNTLPPKKCESGDGRMLVTLVRYVAWASAKESDRAEALRLARVSMPVSPRLFYLLAESDHTLAAARRLVATGEKVTMQDNQRMDALAYALAEGDAAAAGRLLAIGARTDTLVGPEQMPVALLPVASGDVAGVDLMQRAGVDYTQLRFRGMSALDVARQKGDQRLLRALESRSRRL
jgi:tetratricopeptide (TPR) repeat protein